MAIRRCCARPCDSWDVGVLRRMREEGLEFVDVSIGFNTLEASIPWAPNFMAGIAQQVRRGTGLLGGTSWCISKPEEADALLREDKIDLIILGRPLLADPHWRTSCQGPGGLREPGWVTLPPPYAPTGWPGIAEPAQ
ncbi:MAG: hypothetical protein ACRYG8_09700 [Janthinobacterium lividum]